MFERYTDRARRVVVLAQDEAKLLGHTRIGTTHLLLGMVAEGESIAGKALADFGLTLKEVREAAEQAVGRGEDFRAGASIPFSENAKRSLEVAYRRAAQTAGSYYIDTEHILLGVLARDESVAVKVLGSLDVDISQLQRQVLGRIRATEWHRSDDPRTPELIREELDLVELTAELLRTELAEAEDRVHLRITT